MYIFFTRVVTKNVHIFFYNKNEIMNEEIRMDGSVIIYGDLFFLMQLLWNGYLLFLSASLIHYHLSKRIFFAFILIMSLDTFFVFQRIPMRIFLLLIEWGLFYLIGKSKKLCLTLFMVSVAASGFWMLIPKLGCLAALLGTLVLLFYIKYIPKSDIYTVCCSNDGKKVKVKALYDTGNRLYLSGDSEMVSLISYEAIKSVFDWSQIKDPRIVPFSSVGNESGLLFAIPIDSFVILEKNLEIKHPYIGIVEQDLSGNGDFQMILHRDIFMGGNKI